MCLAGVNLFSLTAAKSQKKLKKTSLSMTIRSYLLLKSKAETEFGINWGVKFYFNV
jgi:hypothetical protein